MKITKATLKRLIREEIEKALYEEDLEEYELNEEDLDEQDAYSPIDAEKRPLKRTKYDKTSSATSHGRPSRGGPGKVTAKQPRVKSKSGPGDIKSVAPSTKEMSAARKALRRAKYDKTSSRTRHGN